MELCPACQSIARALIRKAQMFGLDIARDEVALCRVCVDHLPLVVGFTAPRRLAKWLLAALGARRNDPSAFESTPCPLCEAEEAAQEETRRLPVVEATCPNHDGDEGRRLEALKDRLNRIAAGERLKNDEERQILRAGLIDYASIRGSAAFIQRIE